MNYEYSNIHNKLENNIVLRLFRLLRLIELEFEKFINKSAKILDCGCGTGSTSLSLNNKGYYNIRACDIDESLIADFCDIEDIRYLENTYEKESFDAVIVHDVIHHLETKEDYLTAVNSLKSVLKNGGYLFIAEPSPNLFWHFMLLVSRVTKITPTWKGYLTEKPEFDLFFGNLRFIYNLYADNFKVIKSKNSFYRRIFILQK